MRRSRWWRSGSSRRSVDTDTVTDEREVAEEVREEQIDVDNWEAR
jgi:hypothetical protein